MRFFHQNTTANAQAAHEAMLRRAGGGNTSDRAAKFQRVDEVILTQEDIRPAARGKIWSWETGTAQEATYEPITDKVGFNTANIQAAAEEVGFQDLP